MRAAVSDRKSREAEDRARLNFRSRHEGWAGEGSIKAVRAQVGVDPSPGEKALARFNGWTCVTDAIPELGASKLVSGGSGEPQVLCLKENVAYRAGDGSPKLSYAWYPGGKPVENAKFWRDLPACPFRRA